MKKLYGTTAISWQTTYRINDRVLTRSILMPSATLGHSARQIVTVLEEKQRSIVERLFFTSRLGEAWID